MFKRVLIGLLLIVGLIAINRIDVDAHLAGYVYDPTIRHIASYDCTGNFQQVKNLDIHTAAFQCVAIATQYEILCANPQGKITFGNSGPRTVTLSEQTLLTEADITDKVKGNASSTVFFTGIEILQDADQLCKARNPNWSAVKEFVTQWDVFIRTFECPDMRESCNVGDPGAVMAFQALVHCDRPINPNNGQPYTLDPKAKNAPPGGGIPTNYPCNLVSETHFALRQKGAEQPYTLNAGLHSLWNETLKALFMDRNEPYATRHARAEWNTPVM
jgi:hypothetical protein